MWKAFLYRVLFITAFMTDLAANADSLDDTDEVPKIPPLPTFPTMKPPELSPTSQQPTSSSTRLPSPSTTAEIPLTSTLPATSSASTTAATPSTTTEAPTSTASSISGSTSPSTESPMATSPPSTTTDAPVIIEDKSSENPVQKSDPFYSAPEAEQLKCQNAGVSCDNCAYVDWLKLYNKTIGGVGPVLEIIHDSNEQNCFDRCVSTPLCIIYTLNKVDSTCKLHSDVKFEHVLNDTDWSLYTRLYPRMLFLNEWIVSLNTRPLDYPFSTVASPNFLNCTLSCAKQDKCVFAVFAKDDRTCTLFTKGASRFMRYQANLVTMEHFSMTHSDNAWRFAPVGPVYQQEGIAKPKSYTTGGTASCVEDCHARDACQLATVTSGSSGTVDCYLYDLYQNIWYEDDPPSTATNSYYKLVPRNNTMYRVLPHYMQVKKDTPLLEEVCTEDIQLCHEKAQSSVGVFWYSYNSSSGSCKLYDNSVQMQSYQSFPEFDLSTFSKSLPTNYLSYYAYDSSWVSSVSEEAIDRLEGDDSACLERCLELADCTGVAVSRPEGNCSLFTQTEVNKTVHANMGEENKEGIKTIQLFAKLRDPRFIESGERYRCMKEPMITWDEINHVLKYDSLEGIRETFPKDNNAPLEPHAGGFEGQGSGTGSPPTTRFAASTPVIGPRGPGGGRKTQRQVQLGIDFVLTGTFTGGAIGFSTCGGPCGVFGASLGTLVTGAIALGNTIYCWFASCQKEPEREKTCGEECLLRSRPVDGFLELVLRAASCTCDTQPGKRLRGVLGGNEADHEDHPLQEDCRGKHIHEFCTICCRVGYESEESPLCHCGNPPPNYWDPDPAYCRAKTNCIFAQEIYSGVTMPLVRVADCLDNLYFGIVFNPVKRIPFYTIYHFGADNARNGFGREDFVAFPCTDQSLVMNQLTNADYDVMNAIFTYPSSTYWDKGHLVPHADFRWSRDAAFSTFYHANAAPQDHSANVKWGQIEKRIRNLFSEALPGGAMRQGYVLTGVCLDFDTLYPAPDCFWKLACTVTNTGRVTVAAFWHSNAISMTNDDRNEKSRELYQIRDQRGAWTQNLGLAGIQLVDLWQTAANFYQVNVQDFADCYNAASINFPPHFSLPPTPKSVHRADEEEDYELFNFWNDKVFGDGFEPDVDESSTDDTFGQSQAGAPPSCGKKIVGYVTGWSDVKFTQRAASYLTHVIFAFVQMTGDGTLMVGSADPDNSKDVSVDRQKSYLRLREIKAAKDKSGNRIRTIFAVGGWANSQFFSATAANSASTQNFIRSALEILDYFDMDGVDIDWEYPVTGGAQNGVKEDRQNYVNFLRTIRSALNDHASQRGRSSPYSLTIAGAAGAWVLDDGFDLPSISEIVDWINVMTYDYYGAWDSQWGAYTGPHAPLYFAAPQGYSGKTNVDYTLKYYSCRIGNPDKIVMGLGFYGRFWNHSGSPVGEDPVWRKATPNGAGKFDGGFEPWRNIAGGYLTDGQYRRTYHEKTKTPYLENSGGFLMGYEDPQSIYEKVNYAAAKGFGGVMVWAVDLDDDQNHLLRVASSETLCSGGSGVPGEYKCPPIQEQRWWTLLDDEKKAGMCGKMAPLYKGYYPVCDPEDPGYACCSASGYCGSGDNFCKCEGCVDYYSSPEKILDEPIRPSGPVRWHTMDDIEPGQPSCGYDGRKLENGDYAICNPDNDNAHCCSNAGYCGNTPEFCGCEGCVNFRETPDFHYPEKTWIDSGDDAGKCGKQAKVNGNPATCNPMSSNYHCCSESGWCGTGADYCDCDGCVNYKK